MSAPNIVGPASVSTLDLRVHPRVHPEKEKTMKQSILTIFTRTPLHVGAGSSVGAIDQPVIRERHTRFPVIPGSSIKGVLADLWPERVQATDKDGKLRTDKDGKPIMIRTGDGRLLFGSDDDQKADAGKLLIGEGRLLAFPIRAARGCFAWITCPLVLNRFMRDSGKSFPVSTPDEGEVHANTKDAKVIFEEYPLTVKGPIDAKLIEALQGICDDKVWQELPDKLAVVSDELFSYFAENACEIAQHIRIDDETGVVAKGALFNQENVPSETLFYAVVQSHDDAVLTKCAEKLEEVEHLLQFGADATTGLGWCSVAVK